jgi:serine phosphatase RsbU (regulator of sigma subunit)
LAVSSLVGELVVSKLTYGDHITLRKRKQPFTLAAERTWALLPPLTYTSPDVSIAGFLQPPERIAGDAFDYGVTGRVATVAIFDAMGHGLEASRMANHAVATYRNMRRKRTGLLDAMKELDYQIAHEFGDSRFVTAQFASLDLDSGVMEIVNAGHPRPLFMRPGKPVEEVECAPSAPAGVGCVPTVTPVQLAEGDSVMFRTDGVVDARSPGGDVFSDTRLADLVHELHAAELPPSEVVRKVMHAVAEHRARRPGDDAMVVLVRWRAPEGPYVDA